MANTGASVDGVRRLLALAPPVTGPIPAGPRRSIPQPKRPSGSRQGARITPQFNALRDAIEAQRADLAEATTSSDPELVAVFDLAGTVAGFMRAVAGVPGLEFLADVPDESVDPDDDFFFEEDEIATDQPVPQSLYMVMTNAAAVGELVRLFELWQQDPKVKFERGLAPLKDVFALLRAIRRWGPEDRVEETGLLDRWREDVQVVGTQGSKVVEIELWFRASAEERGRAQASVVSAVTESGGTVLASAQHESIAYHGVLAELPMAAVDQVLELGADSIALLKAEAVMLVGPSVPMAIVTGEAVEATGSTYSPKAPEGKPRVALLDGVPLANHELLVGRLTVDDPDDRASEYDAAQRRHGTAMASLIAHGDLSSPGPALTQPIYVRPLLVPHEFLADVEVVPPKELLVDLVHRAFHRIFEGDGDAEAAAPSVRIVNLSIGDPGHAFVRRLSPLARLVDYFAHRYNVLVVVSAGNHTATRPRIAAEALDAPAELSAAVLSAVHDEARLRTLLSPAEATNVLTVGGTHDDSVDIELPDTVLDAIPRGVPANYSPSGFGYRKSVKPEVLLPGGRQLFSAPPDGASGTVELHPISTVGAGPGLAAAAPGEAGELDRVSYSSGTSNAAALGTRCASQVFDFLEAFTAEAEEFPGPDAQYHPVMAKALVVHATGWHDLRDPMLGYLGLSGQSARRELSRVLGYGPVRSDRLVSADSTRVVLFGASSIADAQRQTFEFPLPDSLAASTEWRRLTITLAWLSPINVRSQVYRMARLWFSPPTDELAVLRKEADQAAAKKGTVQHEVLEGSAATAFLAGSTLAINVDCRADAGKFAAPIRYALAATLEVAATSTIDVHAEVRARLNAEVRNRARARV